jgi:hypothetical protein
VKKARQNKTVDVGAILPEGWLAAVDPSATTLGLGMDVGTTTKGTSNPSALALVQKVGFEYRTPLIVRWKSTDPAVARAVIQAVLDALATLHLRVRRLCVDATSEKLFAVDLRRHFSGKLPVELVVSSEALDYGGERMLYKAYLGNLFVNTVEDGYLALPSEEWVKTDVRSVARERGTFNAEILEDGGHGDVFDAVKLALHAIVAKGGGRAEAAAAGVGSLPGHKAARPGLQNPRARRGVPARRWR